MLEKVFGEKGFQIPPDHPDYILHPFNGGVECVINQLCRLGPGAGCCLAADFVHTVRCRMRGQGVIWFRIRDYGQVRGAEVRCCVGADFVIMVRCRSRSRWQGVGADHVIMVRTRVRRRVLLVQVS